MKRLGWVYHDDFLRHETTPGHPERPQRLQAVTDHLEAEGLVAHLHPLVFEAADVARICRLHTRSYVERVEHDCEAGVACLDSGDTPVCPESAQVARLASGGALAACDCVMSGEVDRAFCAMRPPGHHAERDRAMGFCLFNHVALAADHLVREHGLDRVAIVDFDVHHGNGTQHLLESRDDILFISVHQDPATLYPGTGFASETGTDRGQGFTLNIPMTPGSGDTEYARAFDEQVLPRLSAFAPQALLISAGFDAAAEDPLAHIELTPDGFAGMTRSLVQVAGDSADGRVISVLEGGYDLGALGRG
ncbi:MAG: histone deacetylase, partial [Phycisphaerae bacterium]|nr:histone deacetylase [Phycisphaerae bacterium]